jgi:hypothetical protein
MSEISFVDPSNNITNWKLYEGMVEGPIIGLVASEVGWNGALLTALLFTALGTGSQLIVI